MLKNKTDQSHNGELKRRQHQIIPKDKKMHYIPELRLWLLLDKSLTKLQRQAKADYFLTRYLQDQSIVNREMIKRV